MSEPFRASMNWLHTWAGLVVGAVLFAVFWMGTLTVFDREFDRWMMPATRRPPASSVSLDAAARTMAPLAAGGRVRRWGLQTPTDRVPTIRAFLDGEGTRETIHLDPASGAVVAEQHTLGGTGFFFPFHFTLLIDFKRIGEWIVGLAAVTMMAMCVSGVVIHRRIFADFFTIRLGRKRQRTLLDLHNVTGVLGLPFNFMIAFSGLVIFIGVYLPGVQTVLYPGDPAGYGREAFGGFTRPAAGRPAPLASLDAMADAAARRWGGDRVADLRVYNPGDVAAYVTFYRPTDRRVGLDNDPVTFDGPTGRFLEAPPPRRPVMTAQRFISGMHFVQFRHWTLRWLYFICGLAGCTLVATGFLFWVQSRAKRHLTDGVTGMALVKGLTVGATAGLVLATAAMLVANRALPDTAEVLGMVRATAEVRVFLLVWCLAAAHAWLRPAQAWREQSVAIGATAAAAAVLNWATTGDGPWSSIPAGRWAVAGVDLGLLSAALIATFAAVRLSRANAVPATSAPAGALAVAAE